MDGIEVETVGVDVDADAPLETGEAGLDMMLFYNSTYVIMMSIKHCPPSESIHPSTITLPIF